jgi:hypothetical protein
MVEKGISIYCGLHYTLDENRRYIETASELGYSNVFTSLHIPEANLPQLLLEFDQLSKICHEKNMQIASDTSKAALGYLGVSPHDLHEIKRLGIDVLRLDFGFSPEEIASMSNNDLGIKIDLNASTIDEKFVQSIKKYSPDFSNITATHNYYPRPETGLSKEYFKKKNDFLHGLGVAVSAFIPSLIRKRPPLFQGLPTIEDHRFADPKVSAKELVELGCDNIFFGDAIPSYQELLDVSQIEFEEDFLTSRNISLADTSSESEVCEPIRVRVELFTKDEAIVKALLEKVLANRPDHAKDVVRITESRALLKNLPISPMNTIDRKKGYLTIDNDRYLRYKGEIQVIINDLPSDSKVNVIGKITDDDLLLIDKLSSSRFVFIKK